MLPATTLRLSPATDEPVEERPTSHSFWLLAVTGFATSIDAMAMLPRAETHYLTRSMRFGEPVARAATLLLQTMKGDTHAITGLGRMSATLGQVDRSQPYAIISRSNASVFARAVEAIDQSRVHFVGGVQNYLLGKLTDVHHLWSGQRDLVQDAFYRDFDDIGALALHGRETGDKEILSLVSVVREYKAALPGSNASDLTFGHIIEVTETTYTIELTGPGDKLDAFIKALGQNQILETVRSGVSGIARGEKSLRV